MTFRKPIITKERGYFGIRFTSYFAFGFGWRSKVNNKVHKALYMDTRLFRISVGWNIYGRAGFQYKFLKGPARRWSWDTKS